MAKEGILRDNRIIPIPYSDGVKVLIKEWSKEKKSKIIPYTHLGDFTKAKIPEIKSSDKIIEQETKIDNEYPLSMGAAVSRALEDSKLGLAAVSRAFEDSKLGSMALISALKEVEKEKETLMTPRDTEEHENIN